MTSLCRTGNDDYGPDWKPCDCPIHDQVAEMLGLVSTSGKDFRPASSKTPQDHAADALRHAQRARDMATKARQEADALVRRQKEMRELERKIEGIDKRIAEKAAALYPVEHPPRPRKPKDLQDWGKISLLNAREQYELGMLDRNQFMELLNESERLAEKSYDMATVGYHRAPNQTYAQTSALPVCRVCDSNRAVAVIGSPNTPQKAVCVACDHEWRHP